MGNRALAFEIWTLEPATSVYAADEPMKKKDKPMADHEMRPEYHLRGSIRGKYYECYKQGANWCCWNRTSRKCFAILRQSTRRFVDTSQNTEHRRSRLNP